MGQVDAFSSRHAAQDHSVRRSHAMGWGRKGGEGAVWTYVKTYGRNGPVYVSRGEGFAPFGADAPSPPHYIHLSTEMGHRVPMTINALASVLSLFCWASALKGAKPSPLNTYAGPFHPSVRPSVCPYVHTSICPYVRIPPTPAHGRMDGRTDGRTEWS